MHRSPCAPLCALLLSVCPVAQSAPDALAYVSRLEGRWTGSLVYRDYRSGKRVTLPMRAQIEHSAETRTLLQRSVFQDPGHEVHNLDILSLAAEGQRVRCRSFGRRGEETVDYTLVEVRAASESKGFELLLEAEGQDDGKPATVRVAWRYDGVRFIATKTVRPAGADEFAFRNEARLSRAEVAAADATTGGVAVPPNAADLVGRWRVDLRPGPDAEPSYTSFEVTRAGDGTLEGSFYNTPLEHARLNLSWGTAHFAFVTEDGSGPYGTSGRLVSRDKMVGTTHSIGRGFLSVWTAERVEKAQSTSLR